MVSAKINFLSVHQCTLECTLTGSFSLFDFFDLTQIIFHKNSRKLLNTKIDGLTCKSWGDDIKILSSHS